MREQNNPNYYLGGNNGSKRIRMIPLRAIGHLQVLSAATTRTEEQRTAPKEESNG